jgi:tetratricopeptide (TPR) repeat protein
VCYFGIGITGSRGGWLSSLFSLLVFLILSLDLIRRTHRSWFAPALYLSIIAVLALPTGAFLLLQKDGMLSKRVDLLSQITQRDVKTYDIRIHNWTAAIEQWKEAKWTGTGAGTHLYYGRKHRQPAVQQDPQHAHSDYLELLAEYGLIGVGGVAVFLFVHLRSGLRGYRILAQRRAEDPYRPSPQLALNLGALGAFAAYLAHSAVDFNLHLPGNALVFAAIFGLLAHPVTRNPTITRDEEGAQDSRHRTARWPWSLRLVLPVLGVILILTGTSTLPAESWGEKARVSVRSGHFNEAITLSHRALEREKNNPYLYYYLGQAHFSRAQLAPKNARQLDLEAAENAFRSGLALFPQDETPWVRLGQVLDELGRHEEAQTAFETAITLDPNAAILYAYLGEHFRKIGDPEREKEALARGQPLIPFYIGLYFYDASKPPSPP